MSEPSSTGGSQPELEKGRGSNDTDAHAKLVPGSAGDISTASEPAKSRILTAEEQMALYENSLKEEDWGHQPC